MQAAPDQIRQITDDVLSRPEFREQFSWSQFIGERLFDWLRRLSEWSSKNPDLAELLMIVLGVILIALLVHIIYTVVREFSSLRRSDSAADRYRTPAALEGVAENWAHAFQLAKSALDSGELYIAKWITHRILLAVLDRTGKIKFVRWKTNTDYLQECRDSGALGATLMELTLAYERVIYAHSEFDGAEARQLLARVEVLAAEAKL